MNEPSRIVPGVPFAHYLPEVVVGIDPGVPDFMAVGYREGDKVTIMQEGRIVSEGIIGGTLTDGVQYKATRNYDESHIVRGYD